MSKDEAWGQLIKIHRRKRSSSTELTLTGIRICSQLTNTSSLRISFEARNARLTESSLSIRSWGIIGNWISWWRNVIRTMSRGRCCCCWGCRRRRSWLSYTTETACKRWNEKSFQNRTDPTVFRSKVLLLRASFGKTGKKISQVQLTSGENC